MANTPFLDLVKPAGTDRALVSVINSNSDKIDTGVSTLSEQIASKELSPSNGDSLLTWIVGNISSRNTLPFSFVKIGNATMSDIPAFNVPGTEFTGVVYGNSRRITVELSRYANTTYQRWVRHIFDNAWYGDWEQIATNVLTLTSVSFATALAQMKEDSICLLRSWSSQDDYPVTGNGNHQGVIFYGEGGRMIMVYANGDHLYIKTGSTSNSWHQIY